MTRNTRKAGAVHTCRVAGYINTGGNADGPHPLCNDIIP